MCAALNAKFGKHYVPEDFTQYPLRKNITDDEWSWFRDHVKYDSAFMLSLTPLWDAIAALGLLQRAGFTVIVATDRNEPEKSRPVSEHWLQRNGVPYDRLVSLGDDTKLQLAAKYQHAGEKATFFDDDPRKCDFVPSDTTDLWLPLMPYTPAKLPHGCTSFSSWAQPLTALGVDAPFLRKSISFPSYVLVDTHKVLFLSKLR